LRVSFGLWSAAGTWRQVKSQTPQSAAWVLMTEPSVEASRPTMMTVQPSEARSISGPEPAEPGRTATLRPPEARSTAARARRRKGALFAGMANTSRGGRGPAPLN